jgi:hypothetical protein
MCHTVTAAGAGHFGYAHLQINTFLLLIAAHSAIADRYFR